MELQSGDQGKLRPDQGLPHSWRQMLELAEADLELEAGFVLCSRPGRVAKRSDANDRRSGALHRAHRSGPQLLPFAGHTCFFSRLFLSQH